VSEPIGHRPINWNAVSVIVAFGAYLVFGAMAFAVVREQGNNNEKAISRQAEEDRDQNDRIRAIENNRSLETRINDLTIEVRLLRQQVEQSNKDKRR
jgi:uncharacterized protein YlxW (UPF0749 family)